MRKIFRKTNNIGCTTLTSNVFRVVSDDGFEEKLSILRVVGPHLAPTPLNLEVMVDRLHGLLRPRTQAGLQALHLQELHHMLEDNVDLRSDADPQAPVGLLKVLDVGPEAGVQVLKLLMNLSPSSFCGKVLTSSCTSINHRDI